MKARVIETGKIVDIIRNSAFDKDVFYDSKGQEYNREELSFDVKEKSFPKDNPDYWTRLEHQYAGMAMQGMLAGKWTKMIFKCTNSDGQFFDLLAHKAKEVAHALVEKLKELEERK